MVSDFRRALQKHRRDQQELGFEFELVASSLGLAEPLKARVRRVTMNDPDAFEQLSMPVQRVVQEGISELRAEQRRSGRDESESVEETLRGNRKVLRVADAFAKASFISPVLVDTDAEADAHEDAVKVSDIHPEDRIRWFIVCQDADSMAAAKLKLFRPKAVIDVAGGPAQPAEAGGVVRYPQGEAAGLPPRSVLE